MATTELGRLGRDKTFCGGSHVDICRVSATYHKNYIRRIISKARAVVHTYNNREEVVTSILLAHTNSFYDTYLGNLPKLPTDFTFPKPPLPIP